MPRCLLAFAFALAGLVAGCNPAEPEPPPDPAAALLGVWEVTGEAGTLNRNGQRYRFADDGSLEITRPRPLGPTTTIAASYAFVTDSTLEIRSEFDADTLLPVVRGDTLLLRPLRTGEPMLLRRIAEKAPSPTPAPISTQPADTTAPPAP